MKNRKFISILLALVLLLGLLSGCGKSNSSKFDAEYGMAADAPAADSPMESVTDQSAGSMTANLPHNRKMIRTVYMDAQTQDMDALLATLEQQLNTLGGYMENREIYKGSSKTSQWRNANLTLRIPSDKADAFLTQVESSANVLSVTEDLDDVTLDYVATESRITALETERDRLLVLMEEAADLSDLLEVEARLTDVLYELENVTSQLRLYDNLIDYTTIHLGISQVTQLTTPEDEQTVWERISTGFMNTLEDLGDTLVDMFVGLIVASPVLLIIAIPVVAVILLLRRYTKKKKAKAAPAPQPEDPQQ